MVMLHLKMLHHGDIHEGFGSCRQRSPLEEVDSPHAALPQPVIPGGSGKPQGQQGATFKPWCNRPIMLIG